MHLILYANMDLVLGGEGGAAPTPVIRVMGRLLRVRRTQKGGGWRLLIGEGDFNSNSQTKRQSVLR